MTTNTLIGPLALRFGNHTHLIGVRDFAHASAVWCKFRDEQGLGASESPKLTIIHVESGTTIARVSYNGRVWNMAGIEMPLNGCKTAAQHESEGWKDYLCAS